MTTRELECLIDLVKKKDDIREEMPSELLPFPIEVFDREPDVFKEIFSRLVA